MCFTGRRSDTTPAASGFVTSRMMMSEGKFHSFSWEAFAGEIVRRFGRWRRETLRRRKMEECV